MNDMGLSFLGMIPKTQAIKEKIDTLNFIKIRRLFFCVPKDTIKKVKTIHRMRVNICKSHILKGSSIQTIHSTFITKEYNDKPSN